MVRKVSCDNHCSLRQCRPVRARCVRVWAGTVVRKPRSCIEKRFPSTCDCVLHSTASALHLHYICITSALHLHLHLHLQTRPMG